MRAADLFGLAANPALRVRLAHLRPEQVTVRPFPRWLDRIWPGWVAAVTLPWAIYLRDGRANAPHMRELIVHELVHTNQWRTLGWIGFLRVYVGDYLRGRIRLLDHRDAYMAISLEVEAREVAGLAAADPR